MRFAGIKKFPPVVTGQNILACQIFNPAQYSTSMSNSMVRMTTEEVEGNLNLLAIQSCPVRAKASAARYEKAGKGDE